ncbi:acylphosphatase [soil metagenome]
MKALQVFYEGRVQGVGFRYTTKQIAMGFDVAGWVRNLPDGRVELQVAGEDDEVAAFLKEIEEDGELAGNIRHVERHATGLLEGVSGFSIR